MFFDPKNVRTQKSFGHTSFLDSRIFLTQVFFDPTKIVLDHKFVDQKLFWTKIANINFVDLEFFGLKILLDKIALENGV